MPDLRRETLFARALGRRAGARRLRQADVRGHRARPSRSTSGTSDGRRPACGCRRAILGIGAACGLAIALTGHPSRLSGRRAAAGGPPLRAREGALTPRGRQGSGPPPPAPTPARGVVPVAFRRHLRRRGPGDGLHHRQLLDMADPATRCHLLRVGREEFISLHFLIGRHTGMLVYTPFRRARGCFLPSFPSGRRSSERWLLLGVIAAVALSFLVFIAWNLAGRQRLRGQPGTSSAPSPAPPPVTGCRPRWLVVLGTSRRGCSWALPLHAVRGRRARAHAPVARARPALPLPSRWSCRWRTCRARHVPLGDVRIMGGGRRSSPSATPCRWPAPLAWSST